jgi:hypothetical protein
MTTAAQIEYRINHRELRRIARSEEQMRGMSRTAAIEEVCKSRAFWLGDKYSTPAGAGARAALLTLRPTIGDALPFIERSRASIKPGELAGFLRCRHSLRHLWTSKRATNGS